MPGDGDLQEATEAEVAALSHGQVSICCCSLLESPVTKTVVETHDSSARRYMLSSFAPRNRVTPSCFYAFSTLVHHRAGGHAGKKHAKEEAKGDNAALKGAGNPRAWRTGNQ